MTRIVSPVRSPLVSPLRSPLMRSSARLVLPYSAGLLLNLIPDAAHTDLDASAQALRVRGSGPATATQDQADATKRFLWSATSTIGGKAALSKGSGTSHLLTPSGMALSQPFVVYVVVAPPLAAPTFLIFDGSSFSARAVLAYIGTNTWQLLGASGTITSVFVLPNGGALFTCVFDGASSDMRINGASVGTGTTSTAALDLFTIGARFSISNPQGGLIAYFAVQSGHPTAAQLNANDTAIKSFFSI